MKPDNPVQYMIDHLKETYPEQVGRDLHGTNNEQVLAAFLPQPPSKRVLEDPDSDLDLNSDEVASYEH